MDKEHEENLWVSELHVMLDESMLKHLRFQQEADATRSRMALAQVFLCHAMLSSLLENEDWSDFKESVYDYIESETERYREAREAGDRELAIVMLARVRCARTLARRLNNPARQALLDFVPPGTSPYQGLTSGRVKGSPLAEVLKELKLGCEEVQEFQTGIPKEIVPEHKLLLHEMNKLGNEALENLSRAQTLGEPLRTALASAELLTSAYFLKVLVTLDSPSSFREFLLEFTEEAELRYEQARDCEDREVALHLLGWLRVSKTVARRLADPVRRARLLHRIETALIFH